MLFMGRYVCKKCKRSFKRADHLNYHIEHKACKMDKYFCKSCDKGFTSNSNMYRHMKHNCHIKKQNDNEKNEIYEMLLQLQNKNEELEKRIMEQNGKNNREKRELKNRIKEMESMINKNKVIVNNSIIGTNNGTVNNIILVGYGKEDISKIDKNEILRGFKAGFYSTIKLTDAIHFNPKYPEYHNVYISSMKDKYAMMFDGTDWTLVTKTELIDKLYDNNRNYIEENLDDFIDSLTKSQQNALERWMNTDEEHAKIKEVKEKIKLLLYNKRNIPLKTVEMKTN